MRQPCAQEIADCFAKAKWNYDRHLSSWVDLYKLAQSFVNEQNCNQVQIYLKAMRIELLPIPFHCAVIHQYSDPIGDMNGVQGGSTPAVGALPPYPHPRP
jgi:hypothetical protein